MKLNYRLNDLQKFIDKKLGEKKTILGLKKTEDKIFFAFLKKFQKIIDNHGSIDDILKLHWIQQGNEVCSKRVTDEARARVRDGVRGLKYIF